MKRYLNGIMIDLLEGKGLIDDDEWEQRLKERLEESNGLKSQIK